MCSLCVRSKYVIPDYIARENVENLPENKSFNDGVTLKKGEHVLPVPEHKWSQTNIRVYIPCIFETPGRFMEAHTYSLIRPETSSKSSRPQFSMI